MPRKPTRAFKDIELLGGWDAVTKLLAAQKTGKRRLKDEQIKTGLAVSVGGSGNGSCCRSVGLITGGWRPTATPATQ
jgi:hypothetical protein